MEADASTHARDAVARKVVRAQAAEAEADRAHAVAVHHGKGAQMRERRLRPPPQQRAVLHEGRHQRRVLLGRAAAPALAGHVDAEHGVTERRAPLGVSPLERRAPRPLVVDEDARAALGARAVVHQVALEFVGSVAVGLVGGVHGGAS